MSSPKKGSGKRRQTPKGCDKERKQDSTIKVGRGINQRIKRTRGEKKVSHFPDVQRE